MLEKLGNRIERFELVESLVDFIIDLRYEYLPAEAIESAQVFIVECDLQRCRPDFVRAALG